MDLDHERLDVYHLALDFLVLASEIIEGLPLGALKHKRRPQSVYNGVEPSTPPWSTRASQWKAIFHLPGTGTGTPTGGTWIQG